MLSSPFLHRRQQLLQQQSRSHNDGFMSPSFILASMLSTFRRLHTLPILRKGQQQQLLHFWPLVSGCVEDFPAIIWALSDRVLPQHDDIPQQILLFRSFMLELIQGVNYVSNWTIQGVTSATYRWLSLHHPLQTVMWCYKWLSLDSSPFNYESRAVGKKINLFSFLQRSTTLDFHWPSALGQANFTTPCNVVRGSRVRMPRLCTGIGAIFCQ